MGQVSRLHRLAHRLGINRIELLNWWTGEWPDRTLMAQWRCRDCGELSRAHAVYRT
jgi:hypothetical protein